MCDRISRSQQLIYSALAFIFCFSEALRIPTHTLEVHFKPVYIRAFTSSFYQKSLKFVVSGCQFINTLLWILNVWAVLKRHLRGGTHYALISVPSRFPSFCYQDPMKNMVWHINQSSLSSVTSFFTLMKSCHPLHPNKVCVVRSPNKLRLVVFTTYF